MAKSRPKLTSVSSSDLITVGSFQWSHGHKIGEGSYGKVYLGWSKVCPEGMDTSLGRGRGGREALLDRTGEWGVGGSTALTM